MKTQSFLTHVLAVFILLCAIASGAFIIIAISLDIEWAASVSTLFLVVALIINAVGIASAETRKSKK